MFTVFCDTLTQILVCTCTKDCFFVYYKKEYRDHQSSTKAKKDRAARNKVNRKKKCAPGKEIHHKDGNPRNTSLSNCICVAKSTNRGKKEASRLKGSKRNYPKTRKKRT
jgi:hypothetical protein